MAPTEVQARAPAKIILMGEHAVVHQCPAVVATLGLYCRVLIQPASTRLIEVNLPDLGVHRCYSRQTLLDYALQARKAWQLYLHHPGSAAFAALRGQEDDHLVKCAIGETLAHLGPAHTRGMKISICSDIPIGAGLGSSAALAVAVPAAIISYLAEVPDKAVIQRLAHKIEQRQHGLPSGVDHRTILQGGIVRFTPDASGGHTLSPLRVSNEILKDLQVFDTGSAHESTGAVVTAVRQKLTGPGNPLLMSMRRTTDAFISLLQGQHYDRPGLYALVQDYQVLLEQLGVVPHPIRSLIRQIETAGGAAKISGAGALSGSAAGSLLVFAPPSSTPRLGDRPPVSAALAVDGLSVVRA